MSHPNVTTRGHAAATAEQQEPDSPVSGVLNSEQWTTMMRAFAGMLDTKLEEKFQPITRRLDTLEKRMDALEGIQNPSVEHPEQDPKEPEPEPSPPKPASKSDATNITKSSEFTLTTKPEDLGFFDPEHIDETNKGPVLTVGRYLMYRDVYAFTDACKDLASNKPHTETSVKTAIPHCLRGSAKMWYTTELNDLEKLGLRNGSLALWLDTLTNHFKMQDTVALSMLQHQSYGYRELRNGLMPRTYIQEMLHLAKAANYLTVWSQIATVYNSIDIYLRRDLPKPSPTITIGQFLKHIDDVTPNWLEMANYRDRNRPPDTHQQRSQPSHQAQQPRQILPVNHQKGSYQKPGPYPGDARGLAPRLPLNGGKSHAYLVDVTDDGPGTQAVGWYEDEEIDTTLQA